MNVITDIIKLPKMDLENAKNALHLVKVAKA